LFDGGQEMVQLDQVSFSFSGEARFSFSFNP
jgi:hypothetical protein